MNEQEQKLRVAVVDGKIAIHFSDDRMLEFDGPGDAIGLAAALVAAVRDTNPHIRAFEKFRDKYADLTVG